MVRDQEKSKLADLINWKFQNGTFFFAHPLHANIQHDQLTYDVPFMSGHVQHIRMKQEIRML